MPTPLSILHSFDYFFYNITYYITGIEIRQIPPTLFFPPNFKAILLPLPFHIHFEIIVCLYLKNYCWDFDRKALNLYISLGRNAFTCWFFQSMCNVSLHLFRFSSISLVSTGYCSYTLFVFARFTPKHVILYTEPMHGLLDSHLFPF